MVGNASPVAVHTNQMTRPTGEIEIEGLEARIGALPGVERVREAAAAGAAEAYLVGGAVRDALRGVERADLDVVVAGDHLGLVDALGEEARVHDRFGTATVLTPDGSIDDAAARGEAYAAPGALPDVHPAGIVEDLSRRDFTINALAVPLIGEFELIDPHEGVRDLAAAVLRLLHPRSIVDDPTRALRAARYAARLGLEVEPRSLTLIRDADLSTVSEQRTEAELRRIAAEPRPREAFERLAEWGLLELPAEGGARIDAMLGLLDDPAWAELLGLPDAVLAVLTEPSPAALELARLDPESPSAAVAAAHGRPAVELALARVLGARWLDDYVARWRLVRTSISGEDLLEAGVPEGPAIGRGLRAALRARLDGEASNRREELQIALGAAGQRSATG